MTAHYITALYSNCHLLVKTGNHDAGQLQNNLEQEVKAVSRQLGCATEQELFVKLTQLKYSELDRLPPASIFLRIFYLVNSLGEYQPRSSDVDELGRFRFSHSVQQYTGITNNLVLQLIQQSFHDLPFFNDHFKMVPHQSYFFLSHDIDSLYGSLMQDGLWALKHGRFDVLMKLFVNVLIAKPHWFNIDTIMNLESEYDFKSTFYWLVNKGKIDARQTNSDYAISSGKLKHTLQRVEERGFENGLHKSISNEPFSTELARLPKKAVGNRYHYLKFQLPQAYDQVEAAGLKLDASLGFAEHYGFRNNYGYPFSPYNAATGKPYSFLEVPLTVMDGTFQRYMQIPVHETATTIIRFFEQHRHNCLISVLWHNTFFTNYKYQGYREEYIRLLQYLHEQKFGNLNQAGIIDTFAWKK